MIFGLSLGVLMFFFNMYCMVVCMFFVVLFILRDFISIVVERIVVMGLVMFCFVACGKELWMGLNMEVCMFIEVEGNRLIEFVKMFVLLLRIFLNILLVRMILNWLGYWISCMVVLFINMKFSFIFGYLGVIVCMACCYNWEVLSILVLFISVIFWWCSIVCLKARWVMWLILFIWYE